MTTIGTFTAAKDGFLQGKIKTLTLNLAKVTLEPVNSDHDSAPAFRLFANGIKLGAAWAKTAKESGRRYGQGPAHPPSSRRTMAQCRAARAALRFHSRAASRSALSAASRAS